MEKSSNQALLEAIKKALIAKYAKSARKVDVE